MVNAITVRNDASYIQLRKAMIKLFEAKYNYVYTDDKGLATIGYGFNIKGDSKLANAVFDALKIPTDRDGKDLGLRKKLTDAINAYSTADQKAENNSLKTQLDAILLANAAALHAADPSVNISTSFNISDAQIDAIFEIAIVPREDTLDGWLNGIEIKEVGQRAALISLTWNAFIHDPINKVDAQGQPFISIGMPNFRQALASGDRAEAWYQLLYRQASPSGRHYAEAQIFGLYADATKVEDIDAKKVVDMFLKYKDSLAKQVKAGVDIGSSYIAALGQPQYSKITGKATIDSAHQILKPISAFLIDKYLGENPAHLLGKDFQFDGEVNLGLETGGSITFSNFESAYKDKADLLIAVDETKNNRLEGGVGNDVVIGAKLNDTLDGGADNDVLAGKEGEDTLTGGAGNDTLIGGDGNNTLYGNDDDDKIYGGKDDDFIIGGSGKDTIEGGLGNNEIFGGEGDDSITSKSGTDHIFGDGGSDTITATVGGAYLEGGEGSDTYIFSGSFGAQAIVDTDGRIVVGGQTLSNFYKLKASEDTYKIGSSFTAKTVGSSLLITASGANTGTIEIKNWVKGDLGITLTKASPLPEVKPPPVPIAPRVDPLSIDLNANGIVDTLPIAAGIHFDLDNNGFAERTSWVAPTDGMLVLDRNSNSKIDGGAELFGTETKLIDGTFAQNGFVALAEFDLNKDGKIDSQDAIYTQLRVWKDANSNGITDSGELQTLAATDIASLDVTYTSNTTTDANNVQHREAGIFTRSGGTTGITNTLWFESDKQATIPVEELNGDGIPLTAEIEALPDAKGFGNIYSLRQAMSLDSSGLLQQKVQAFANETDIATRKTLVNDILILWTGQQNTAADSRGGNIDAKQLGVLETFWGQPAQQANPMGLYAVDLKNVYQQLSMSIYAQMASYQQAEVLSTINWSTTNGVLTADFSSAAAYFSNLFNQNDVSATFKLKDFLEIIKGAEPYNSASAVNSAAFSEALQSTSGSMSSSAFISMASVFYSQPSGLIGTATSDILRGTDANNVMDGIEGHDVIVGGRGNDSLSGGSGNDVYLFSRGDGNDIITEYSGKDAIKFDAGILESDVKIHRTFVDIVLTLNTGESISVNNMISSSSGAITANAIESIQFANGSVWDLHRIKQEAVRGSDLADVLYGFDTNDVISSGAGNDQIIDYVGSNTFAGGQGNDTLSGGNSNDIYLFSRGDGNDFINDSIGNDVIKFGAGIVENDVRILRTADKFMVTLNTGESITVNNMVNLSGFKGKRRPNHTLPPQSVLI